MRGLKEVGRNVWKLQWYVDGRRFRKILRDIPKKAAIDCLAGIRVKIARGEFLGIRDRNKVKFEKFADTFLSRHSKTNNKPSSYDRNVNLVKKLSMSFGGRYLNEITSALVEEYKGKRASEGKASGTINREVACLKCMLNKAVEWEELSDNPIKNVKLLRENNARLRFLEREEIDKLLANCPQHLRPVVAVALNTGMRRSEILNLKWRDIDVNRRLIYLDDTKNGERREVPMNDSAMKTLIAIPKHPDSEYVFCNEDGKTYYNLRKSFFTACTKAGIIDFRFHDLRHTFASQLVMAGVDLNTVRELLGHKSLEMTLRYSHLSQSHKARAVDILSKRLETGKPPQNSHSVKDFEMEFADDLELSSEKLLAPVAQMDSPTVVRQEEASIFAAWANTDNNIAPVAQMDRAQVS